MLAIQAICTKWGFWEEAPGLRRADGVIGGKGGVSLMSHSNGSVAHGWSECLRWIWAALSTSPDGLPEPRTEELFC